MNILTVSELNEKIKNLLESHFVEVYVEGEISRPTYHSSGHLYFTLKDENSALKCVMFRSSARALRFRLEDGQKVIVYGKISVYKPRGEYQLYALSIEPSGAGSLAIAFEQLKKKLEAKGYFNKAYKKPIPKYIDSIALVTSRTGAALQDMLRVAKKRWPLVKIYIINTLVQGKEAAFDIANSIKLADTLGVDLIIVGRGGGSIEDLWPFNEEVVADAIFGAKTPIVSAVGHEIDFLISDFVADLRAPTPSAAMEMVLPDRDEMLLYLDSLQTQFDSSVKKIFKQKSDYLNHIFISFEHNSPTKKLEFYLRDIKTLKNQFNSNLSFTLERRENLLKELESSFKNAVNNIFIHKQNMVENLNNQFQLAKDSKKMKKGFAQIVKDNKIVELEELKLDDIFELQNEKVKVKAKVLDRMVIGD